jgi:1-deoxy-D-xylulose-5-phosphate synthase
VCLQNLPVVFAIDRAWIVGEDGATHNGIFDMAFLRSIPNMTVMAPADGDELREMLTEALEIDGPVAIRYPRGETGKKIDHRPQTTDHRIVIIAIGSMVEPAIGAAALLEKNGIGAKVINAKYIKPLDKKLILRAIKGAEKIVTVEEGVLDGGFGSAVLELLAEEKIDVTVVRLGLPSEFIGHGKREQILDKYCLTAEKICRKIKEEVKVC